MRPPLRQIDSVETAFPDTGEVLVLRELDINLWPQLSSLEKIIELTPENLLHIGEFPTDVGQRFRF